MTNILNSNGLSRTKYIIVEVDDKIYSSAMPRFHVLVMALI